MARGKTKNIKLRGDFVEIYEGHFINTVFLLRHFQDVKDKAILRFIGKDENDRMEFDLFRIHPELEDVRYGAGSAHKALTLKQFSKKFNEYEFISIDYNENKEWEAFIDSAHHIYRYQKLL